MKKQQKKTLNVTHSRVITIINHLLAFDFSANWFVVVCFCFFLDGVADFPLIIATEPKTK